MTTPTTIPIDLTGCPTAGQYLAHAAPTDPLVCHDGPSLLAACAQAGPLLSNDCRVVPGDAHSSAEVAAVRHEAAVTGASGALAVAIVTAAVVAVIVRGRGDGGGWHDDGPAPARPLAPTGSLR